jgi:hypothetical protein
VTWMLDAVALSLCNASYRPYGKGSKLQASIRQCLAVSDDMLLELGQGADDSSRVVRQVAPRTSRRCTRRVIKSERRLRQLNFCFKM